MTGSFVQVQKFYLFWTVINIIFHCLLDNDFLSSLQPENS